MTIDRRFIIDNRQPNGLYFNEDLMWFVCNMWRWFGLTILLLRLCVQGVCSAVYLWMLQLFEMFTCYISVDVQTAY